MNKTLKDALILAVIGLVVGTMIGFGIYYWTEARYLAAPYYGLNPQVIFEIIVGGLQGALAMGTTVIYKIESWSILKCTMTHFIIAMGGFFAMAAIQGWLDFGNPGFIIILVIMLLIYLMIWMMQYISYRHMVRKMNDELEKIREKK